MSGEHLNQEELLALREPGLEPGVSTLRQHLDECTTCRQQADRLDQRRARLRALPSLRPARDHWPVVQARLQADRRSRQFRRGALVGLAAAAVLAIAVAIRAPHTAGIVHDVAIDSVMSRSQQLERLLQAYNPESRVTDGMTARLAGDLEDRIAVVDRRLEMAQLLENEQRETAMLQLWRQRVGLLDALVDVHLTQASAVGF